MSNQSIMDRETRCNSCAYLYEDENGKWICDDCGRDIHFIDDTDCAAEQAWALQGSYLDWRN